MAFSAYASSCINLTEWTSILSTAFVFIVISPPHSNRILRRRVVWLLGCWTGVKLSLVLRPTLYTALLPLLGTSEDLVVRIEAALTLKLDILFLSLINHISGNALMGSYTTLRHEYNYSYNVSMCTQISLLSPWKHFLTVDIWY